MMHFRNRISLKRILTAWDMGALMVHPGVGTEKIEEALKDLSELFKYEETKYQKNKKKKERYERKRRI